MLLEDSWNLKFVYWLMPVLNLAPSRYTIYGRLSTSMYSYIRPADSVRCWIHIFSGNVSDKNLGGACGEIHAMLKSGKKLLNPLVAAQKWVSCLLLDWQSLILLADTTVLHCLHCCSFEYKMSSKPLRCTRPQRSNTYSWHSQTFSTSLLNLHSVTSPSCRVLSQHTDTVPC